MIVADIM